MLNDRTNRAPVPRSTRFATIAAALLLSVALAAAQAAFSTFSGTVFDEQNGFIPGATLVLTNPQNQSKYEVVTDRTGHFEFVGLPPGDYELETKVMGFATLRGTLDPLDSALVALDPTAGALEPGLRSLRSFALEARPALDALREPVRRLVPLATTLRPTAASLRGAFASLRPQAPRLDRVTARIVPCESAVQGFFQWTPSVFKLGDAHGAYPRGHSIQTTNQQLHKAASCAVSSAIIPYRESMSRFSRAKRSATCTASETPRYPSD